jgi:hypothetical protein
MPTAAMETLQTLLTLPSFARESHVPLSTVQYWTKKNTEGFRDACIVEIDHVRFVIAEAAMAWLARPRYPRPGPGRED